jgi:glycyl-tRNA synthetase
MRNLFLDQGFRHDVVEAVLVTQGENPARAARAMKELTGWVERPDWHTILPAYARCVRITRSLDQVYSTSPEHLVEPAERELFRNLQAAVDKPKAPGSVDDFLSAFLPLVPSINLFFDEVLVMTEDTTLRENRLGMLQRISRMAGGVADLSKLEGF